MDTDWKQQVWRYGGDRIPPSPFVQAILANDINRARKHATLEEWGMVHEIVDYIHQFLPASSHGSLDAVNVWLAHFLPPEEAHNE